MRTLRTILLLAVALLIASPLLAAAPAKEKKEKKAPPCPAAERIAKWTEGLTFTDEQKTKLGELKKEFGPKLMEAIKKGDVLTKDQKKARAEAMKEAKAAGKKGKEFNEAVDKATNLTDEQKAKQADARKEVTSLEKQLREKMMGVLSADQKEQLKKKAEEAKKKVKKATQK